jgi:hypothetical protein
LESELTSDLAGRTRETAILSEEVYLGQFGKDRLAAMSQEQLEQALAWAKQRVVEFEESEKEIRRRDEEEGCYTHISVFDRMCHWDVMFYETELELRKRRALHEDRLTLLKELRKVKRELGYDRDKFPDQREIVLSELLEEKGGPCLGDRRYWRAADEESKALDEELERERLLRDEPHPARPEDPRDD